MKIEKLLKKLLQLHDKRIDLSLDRINRLNKDLKTNIGRLQNKTITVSGTNAKWSVATTIRSIFEAAGYKVDLFTSPHVQKYTERFVFESKEISEKNLLNLISEVSKVNGQKPITIFELLTAAFYFYSDTKSQSDILIAENGLFQRYDSVSSIGRHLMNITCQIGLDHLDWLPEDKKTIDQIIIEKTSNIKSANIVVAKQSDNTILEKIRHNIKNNPAKKIFFSSDYSYKINEDGFLYQDKYGSFQLPKPNLLGDWQIANAACAISAIKNLQKYEIKNEHIIKGIKSVKNNKGRLELLDKGLLKKIAPNSTIYLDIGHNPDAGSQISKFLNTLNKNIPITMICGMMNNKLHHQFLSNFKKVNEIVAVDIPNQKNCIKKEELKKIIEAIGIKAKTENSIENAVRYLSNKNSESVILVIGSIFLIGEVLNLN